MADEHSRLTGTTAGRSVLRVQLKGRVETVSQPHVRGGTASEAILAADLVRQPPPRSLALPSPSAAGGGGWHDDQLPQRWEVLCVCVCVCVCVRAHLPVVVV